MAVIRALVRSCLDSFFRLRARARPLRPALPRSGPGGVPPFPSCLLHYAHTLRPQCCACALSPPLSLLCHLVQCHCCACVRPPTHSVLLNCVPNHAFLKQVASARPPLTPYLHAQRAG
eukprot:5180136-Pleurochrysis_carterae.AAC.1